MDINTPDFSFQGHIDPNSVIQAFQRKAQIEQENKLKYQQQNGQAWESIAQGASSAVSSLVQRSKLQQRKDFVNSLASTMATTQGTDATTGQPTSMFDANKAQTLRTAGNLDPEAFAKTAIEYTANPYALAQKQEQFLNTQSNVQTKQRELATSGPYHDSLTAQGRELGIADQEMTGLQNKDLETRINQELRQKQIEAFGTRASVQQAKTAGDVAKQIDPMLAKPSDQIGQEFSRLKGAQRMLTVAGTRGGNLTPQQLSTVGAEVANLAIAGGSNQRMAAEMIDKYIPDTIASGLAAKIQWLKNKPQDARAQEVIRPMLLEGTRIAIESEQNIRNTQLQAIDEAVAAGTISKGQARIFKQRQGIDPDTDEIKRSVIPNFSPKDWYDQLNGLTGQQSTPDILHTNNGSNGIPQIGQMFNGAKVLKVTKVR